MTKKHQKSYCRFCLAELNFTHSPTGVDPNQGDIGVCANCMCVGEYDADLNIVELSTATQLLIATDEKLRADVFELFTYILTVKFKV